MAPTRSDERRTGVGAAPALGRRTLIGAAGLGIASSALSTAASATSISAETTPTDGGSLSFDGAGGHLSVPVTDTADLVPGTGDYTVEWWVKESSSSSKGSPRMFAFGGSAAGDTALLGVSREFSNYQLVLWHTGIPLYPYPVGAPDGLKGAWHHLAVCRSSGQVRVFLDGARVADATSGSGFQGRDLANNSLSPFRIGAKSSSPDASSGENLQGLITDFRYVIGRALYTGETLTVPTAPLEAVTDTALLFRATTAETLLLDASGGARHGTNVAVGASSVTWSSDSPYAPT